MKPLQVILENNILWTKKNNNNNKRSSQGRFYDHGSYNEMKAFFTVWQSQIAFDYIIIFKVRYYHNIS